MNRHSVELVAANTAAGKGPFITVAMAALRLGRSKSTVYRIDREHGPFRFVVTGRRIFINLADFEVYLLNLNGGISAADNESEQLERQSPPQEAQLGISLCQDDIQVTSLETSSLAETPQAWESCGQRELILPRRSLHFIKGMFELERPKHDYSAWTPPNSRWQLSQ